MCRRNQLWAFVLIAFGLGLLVGLCLSSGFVCCCLGIGAVVMGLFVLQRK